MFPFDAFRYVIPLDINTSILFFTMVLLIVCERLVPSRLRFDIVVLTCSLLSGTCPQALQDLVMKLNNEEGLAEGVLKFNAFIFGLLK